MPDLIDYILPNNNINTDKKDVRPKIRLYAFLSVL